MTEPLVMKVWCVWSESGEYEQFSRDLRGIFVSRDLAESHANQVRQDGRYDLVDVVEDHVLSDLPVRVPYVLFAAHIAPDGAEDKELGYHRGSTWQTWSNELRPLDQARTDSWTNRVKKDLYIEVVGSDRALVSAEYARRLDEARASLADDTVNLDRRNSSLPTIVQKSAKS